MPASFVFKPLQANLIYDKDKVGSMDPYCIITLGHHSAKTDIARSEGVHPHWEDVISLERKHDETFCYIKIEDYDTASSNDLVGEARICLEAVEVKGRIIQWYSVFHQSRLAGELLLDIEYVPEISIPVQSLVEAPAHIQTSVVEQHTQVQPIVQPVVQHSTIAHVQPQTYVQPVTQHASTYNPPLVQQSYVQPVTQHTYTQPIVQQSYVQSQTQTHVQPVTQHTSTYTQPVVQQSHVQVQPVTQYTSTYTQPLGQHSYVQPVTQHTSTYTQPVVNQSYVQPVVQQSIVQSGVQTVQSSVAESRVQQYL